MKTFRVMAFASTAILTVCLATSPARAAEEQESTPRPEIAGSLNDKPFLKRLGRGVSVGGYIDMELLADENGSTFDQHRFIPFLYAQVSELVSVASEIEFEHGGFVAGDKETDGEVKLEFAHVDLNAAEWLSFRAGLILSPLGRFNLTHDSPANDLTDRPLMANRIIPTTLSESGLGVFGRFYPSENSVMTYEAYVVNGFNEGIVKRTEGGPTGDIRIRDGRGSAKSDNNNSRAVVGRVGLSPALGSDIGASVHSGRYTDQDNPSRSLTIVALDGLYARGPFEILGEVAFASIDPLRDPLALNSGTVPAGTDLTLAPTESQNGFYAQVNYHFLAGAVKSLPNSIFTAVLRFDQVDFNTDRDGDRERRASAGVNFRPTEDTAVKLNVQRTWKASPGANTDGFGFDALRLSLASYF